MTLVLTPGCVDPREQEVEGQKIQPRGVSCRVEPNYRSEELDLRCSSQCPPTTVTSPLETVPEAHRLLHSVLQVAAPL